MNLLELEATENSEEKKTRLNGKEKNTFKFLFYQIHFGSIKRITEPILFFHRNHLF